ncbi:MAG: hypothetical protein ABI537_09870 [Casimicrobiaceae bacterium]
MKSLLDPSFRYVPSQQTDLRKTFARVRQEQFAENRGPVRAPASNDAKVDPLFLAATRASN